MPKGDRTGTIGAGARSGRGMGFCAGMQRPGVRGMRMGRRQRGWNGPADSGRGQCRGPFGRGGPGRRHSNQLPEAGQSLSPEQEAAILRRRSQALQTELEATHQQLEDLKKQEAVS